MITEFLSNFSSSQHARIIIECLEVLAKNFQVAYFKDKDAKDAMIDSAIAYLQSLKDVKDV